MLRRLRDLLRDLRAQRGETAALRREAAEVRRVLDELPTRLAEQLRRSGELESINRTLIELGTFVHERLSTAEALDDLTKAGWRRARPTVELTWNTAMTGDEFVGHLVATCGRRFGRVVEIGPGYGRVLKTLLASDVRFDAYQGFDLSAENTQYLRTTFADPRLRFANTDFLAARPAEPADLIYSSAVFLHLYPSVAPALEWCHRALGDGGHVCFDVPQGQRRYIDASWGLFVREYEEPELREHAAAAGFASCTVISERDFAPGVSGWFVAAEKRAG